MRRVILLETELEFLFDNDFCTSQSKFLCNISFFVNTLI